MGWNQIVALIQRSLSKGGCFILLLGPPTGYYGYASLTHATHNAYTLGAMGKRSLPVRAWGARDVRAHTGKLRLPMPPVEESCRTTRAAANTICRPMPTN